MNDLLNKSLEKLDIKYGSIIYGKIIYIEKDYVLVDAGLKSECEIPIEEFKNVYGVLENKLGDLVEVVLEILENGFGETKLSRLKAKKYKSWLYLEKAYEKSTIVKGILTTKVKGGFTIDFNGLSAFLPGSQIDLRKIINLKKIEGKVLEFKVIKMDKLRNNVVVSRRAVITEENNIERNNLLKKLQVGMKIKGIVKNLTNYGAFIDLGGVDGLLHITDMSWKKVKNPNNIVKLNEEITVKILKFDRESNRVSLGLKQLSLDPWIYIAKRYKKGTKFIGKITNITDYGCFVEIDSGIEGLVHVSEIDWKKKNINPFKLFNIGKQVEVIVLDININRRRISLGMKQCYFNPWKNYSKKHKIGDLVTGKIKELTAFGIFVVLELGIYGLVHITDISWQTEKNIKQYKKGEQITAIILKIDTIKQRIFLGIKQLIDNYLDKYISKHKNGDLVKCIINKKYNKCLKVELNKNYFGYIIYNKFNNKFKNILNIGDIVKSKILFIDKINQLIYLSIYNNYIYINYKTFFKQFKKLIKNYFNIFITYNIS